MSDEELTEKINAVKSYEPMLRHFRFAHLRSERMKAMSRGFAETALMIAYSVPGSAERTVALRKLVESKDAAVRCVVDVEDAEREREELFKAAGVER